MTLVETLERLTHCTEALKSRGATALYLYGSSARGEARADSDLDLFIDHDARRSFSLVDLAGIKNLIEDELSVEVDIVTRDSLHPLLRGDIERSAIRVF